ncbi:EKC/KEOPS complex subunit TP53RK-like isoform X2 [Hydractinia symbiolongicarpus]|nr:EKC/KEOPS complex subunit TP53RK-like isoform X2 [Hydractinia symbiolongicarpus]
MNEEMEVIKQGAEAKLYRSKLFGKNVIIKQRFNKLYRHQLMDEKLTHKRTLQEARAMLKCRKVGIRTPLIYFVDLSSHEIYMEEIEDSVTLRDEIDSLLQKNTVEGKNLLIEIITTVGRLIAKLHSVDIIHGDLTTSNILLQKKETNLLTLIDFGLSVTSVFNEDKGVDLYVLERAFLSTHPDTEELFQMLLESYQKNYEGKVDEVIEKLNEVRLRGRKRVMIG